jgi:hypothetical protein
MVNFVVANLRFHAVRAAVGCVDIVKRRNKAVDRKRFAGKPLCPFIFKHKVGVKTTGSSVFNGSPLREDRTFTG